MLRASLARPCETRPTYGMTSYGVWTDDRSGAGATKFCVVDKRITVTFDGPKHGDQSHVEWLMSKDDPSAVDKREKTEKRIWQEPFAASAKHTKLLGTFASGTTS